MNNNIFEIAVKHLNMHDYSNDSESADAATHQTLRPIAQTVKSNNLK